MVFLKSELLDRMSLVPVDPSPVEVPTLGGGFQVELEEEGAAVTSLDDVPVPRGERGVEEEEEEAATLGAFHMDPEEEGRGGGASLDEVPTLGGAFHVEPEEEGGRASLDEVPTLGVAFQVEPEEDGAILASLEDVPVPRGESGAEDCAGCARRSLRPVEPVFALKKEGRRL